MKNDYLTSLRWFRRFCKAVGVVDRAKQWEIIFTGLIFVISTFTIIPLIDTYYSYSFEPDSQETIDISISFAKALQNRNISFLAPLQRDSPYFDAQFFISAIGSLLLRLAQHLHIFNLEFLQTEQELMIFTIRHINALVNILSRIIFFKSLKLISCSNWIALLVVLIYIFNYQTNEIDLMRIDQLGLPLLIIVSYLSFLLIKHPNFKALSATLGILIAFLLNTKMTAFTFAYIPTATILFLLWNKRYRLVDFCLLILFFGMTFLLLFIRYIINFPILGSVLQDRATDLKMWYSIMSKEPYFYYNIEYFQRYGNIFFILFLMAFATVLYSLYRRFSIVEFVVLSSLIGFSLMGIQAPKTQRWGIHFIPIYLWVITIAITFWRYQLKRLTQAKVLRAFCYFMIAILLWQPTWLLFENYKLILNKAEQRTVSIKITREEPRKWFMQNVPPSTRVACYYPGAFSNPPIFDLPLDFSSSRFLSYPYLKAEEMAKFLPPTLYQLEASVDVIMLQNIHKDAHIQGLQGVNLKEQADAWIAFYKEIDAKYKKIVFKYDYDNYGLSEVDIYILSRNLLQHLGQKS